MSKLLISDKSYDAINSKQEFSIEEKVKLFKGVENEALLFKTYEKFLIQNKVASFEIQLY